MKYEQLVQQAYQNAKNKGFHTTELSNQHWMALIISELSEGLEADRKGRYVRHLAQKSYIEDLHSFCAPIFESYFKDTFQDEIADTCIRIFDFCGLKGINVIIPQQMKENALKELKDMSTAEMIFTIQCVICGDEMLMVKMNLTLAYLLALSELKGFDLKFFIEEKMKYNETREYRHGKAY